MRIRPAVPADAEGIARVHVDSWRTTYAGHVPDETLAKQSYASRQQQWERTITICPVYVAEAPDGRIVGFTSGGANRDQDHDFSAEIYTLYLLAEHQRGGIGRRLVQALVDELSAQEHTSLLVYVLATNPSRTFYEALGGEYVATKPITIDGASYEDVAYGWRNLRALAERLRGAP